MVGAMASNLWLAGSGPVYLVLLMGQIGFYGLAALGGVSERRGRRTRIPAVAFYFCVVNAAGIVGLLRALRGRAEATWQPVRSA
jgi:hypothetical protein